MSESPLQLSIKMACWLNDSIIGKSIVPPRYTIANYHGLRDVTSTLDEWLPSL